MSSLLGVLTQDILVTSILMGLIALVGLVGNVLMLRALLRYKELRTDFYTVFGCLSIADSLFLIISVPGHIMEMVFAEEVTDNWCKGSHYFVNTCGFIAAYLMVVLALLRGILLTNRNMIHRPRAIHLLIVCAVISGITLLCSLPIMFMYTSYNFMCDLVDPLNQQSRNTLTWLLSSFSAFVPLVLVMVIYLMTYILGKRYFSDSYSLTEKEKSRLVSCIIIAFTLCQLPYRIATIYELSIDDLAQYSRMYTIKGYLMCLVMADKAVRPVLYTKLASDLSEAFDEVINCTYCSKHYSMGSRFGRSATYVATSTSPNTVLLDARPAETNARNADRAMSSSSSASATSQTPLTRKEEDTEMGIEVIQG